jgi:nitrate reductase NapE component
VFGDQKLATVKAAAMRNAIKTLLVLALSLPVVQAVLVGVGGLLAGMGDASGATIVRGVGTACLVVWAVSLVGLVIALGGAALEERAREDEE